MDRQKLDTLAESTAKRQADSARTLLSGGAHPLPVLELASRAASAADALIDSSPDRPRRACQAGCSACCHLSVSLTAAEALWIAASLRATRSVEQVTRLRTEIERTAARVSDLTIEERARARVPCALLGPDGACTIYDFRPLGCRGWTSFSRENCEAALRDERPGHDGPMDPVAWIASGSTTEGLERTFRELGLDAGQYEFHSAVLRALDIPDASSRWTAGQDVFVACARVRSWLLREAAQR